MKRGLHARDAPAQAGNATATIQRPPLSNVVRLQAMYRFCPDDQMYWALFRTGLISSFIAFRISVTKQYLCSRPTSKRRYGARSISKVFKLSTIPSSSQSRLRSALYIDVTLTVSHPKHSSTADTQ